MKPQTEVVFDDAEILDLALVTAQSWEDLAAEHAAAAQKANAEAVTMTTALKQLEDELFALRDRLTAAAEAKDAKLRERDEKQRSSEAAKNKAAHYRFMVEATCKAANITHPMEPSTVTVLPAGDQKVANGDPRTGAMAAPTANGRQA